MSRSIRFLFFESFYLCSFFVFFFNLRKLRNIGTRTLTHTITVYIVVHYIAVFEKAISLLRVSVAIYQSALLNFSATNMADLQGNSIASSCCNHSSSKVVLILNRIGQELAGIEETHYSSIDFAKNNVVTNYYKRL